MKNLLLLLLAAGLGVSLYFNYTNREKTSQDKTANKKEVLNVQPDSINITIEIPKDKIVTQAKNIHTSANLNSPLAIETNTLESVMINATTPANCDSPCEVITKFIAKGGVHPPNVIEDFYIYMKLSEFNKILKRIHSKAVKNADYKNSMKMEK